MGMGKVNLAVVEDKQDHFFIFVRYARSICSSLYIMGPCDYLHCARLSKLSKIKKNIDKPYPWWASELSNTVGRGLYPHPTYKTASRGHKNLYKHVQEDLLTI